MIRFVLDTTALAAAQNDELEALSSDIKRLYELAPTSGKSVTVAIIGHTDQLGSDDKNLRLSRDRADGVKAMLAQKLDERMQLTTMGRGTKEPVRVERTEEDKEANRSVTVKITLTDVP